MEGWRERPGVDMWVVTNYVLIRQGYGRKSLLAVREHCDAALRDLPHDHCARFLVYMLAETYALLQVPEGLLETWKEFQPYFASAPAEEEFFDTRRLHLLEEIPTWIDYLMEGKEWRFAWAVRWARFKKGFTTDT